jgi:hypothetical protein
MGLLKNLKFSSRFLRVSAARSRGNFRPGGPGGLSPAVGKTPRLVHRGWSPSKRAEPPYSERGRALPTWKPTRLRISETGVPVAIPAKGDQPAPVPQYADRIGALALAVPVRIYELSLGLQRSANLDEARKRGGWTCCCLRPEPEVTETAQAAIESAKALTFAEAQATLPASYPVTPMLPDQDQLRHSTLPPTNTKAAMA